MRKKILIAVAFVVAAFVVFVSLRPSDFRVERSINIAAPASAVFVQVNNFHNWDAWSPWARLDPKAKLTLEGPAEGIGAIYSWDGNSDVGAGRMTLTDSQVNALVRIKLELFKPFTATNTTEFSFKSEGAETHVSWSMTGQNNFIAKLMGLFMDCDKMIGGDFEKGLQQMKTLSEGLAKK